MFAKQIEPQISFIMLSVYTDDVQADAQIPGEVAMRFIGRSETAVLNQVENALRLSGYDGAEKLQRRTCTHQRQEPCNAGCAIRWFDREGNITHRSFSANCIDGRYSEDEAEACEDKLAKMAELDVYRIAEAQANEGAVRYGRKKELVPA